MQSFPSGSIELKTRPPVAKGAFSRIVLSQHSNPSPSGCPPYQLSHAVDMAKFISEGISVLDNALTQYRVLSLFTDLFRALDISPCRYCEELAMPFSSLLIGLLVGNYAI